MQGSAPLLADRRGAILCFAVPILLASFFGTVFSRPDGVESSRFAILLVDEDHEPLARRVIAGLRASPRLDVCEMDRPSVQRRLDDQSAGVALVLRPGFRRAKLLGPSADSVEILYHASSEVESRIVEGLFTEVAFREFAQDMLAPILRTHPDWKLDRPFTIEPANSSFGGTRVQLL